MTSYVLAMFVKYAGATTYTQGAMTGFLVWLGFVATSTSASVLFEKKPLKLYLIFNGYQLLYLVLTGMMLAAWV